MKRLAVLVLAGIGLLALASTGCSTKVSAEPSTDSTIAIHHSHFQPGTLTVRAGQPVTFTLRNDDPIEHEWIVGTEEVHQRHRLGTEPDHNQIPTEVTIPALSTRLTTISFDQPGTLTFVCHLPGHEAYGMRGTLRVVAN